MHSTRKVFILTYWRDIMVSRLSAILMMLILVIASDASATPGWSTAKSVTGIATGAYGFQAYVSLGDSFSCHGFNVVAMDQADTAFVQRQISLITAAYLAGRKIVVYVDDSSGNYAYNGWCRLLGVGL